MNIFNKFLKLKTWQKLGIGIALLTIFKYLTMNGFIIDVHAKTDTDAIPGVVLIDLESGLPIEQKLPCTSNNRICTNLDFSLDDPDIRQTRLLTNYFYGNNVASWQSKTIYHIFTANDLPYFSLQEEDTYYNRFYLSPLYFINFMRNTHYSFMFTFESDNVIPYDKVINTQDLVFKIGIAGSIEMNNYIENTEVTFYPAGTITNNSNYSFLKIDFDTLPTLPYTCVTGVCHADNTVYFDLYFDQNNVNKYFYHNVNTNGALTISQSVMVQDATLEVIPTTNYDEFFGLTGGSPLKDDSIYEDCSQYGITEIGENIACNTRNVVSGVKHFLDNLLFNIVNTFEYIFVPDFDNLQQRIDTLENDFFNKYPDIDKLFDYIEYVGNRLNNLQRQTTITFNGVKVPGYDTYIIEPFTFDFNTILNDPTISFYYSIVRIVIIALVTFGFVLFELRFIKSILHSLPLDYGGGN